MRIETLAPIYVKPEVEGGLVRTSKSLIPGDEIHEEEPEILTMDNKSQSAVPFEVDGERYYVLEKDLDISRQDPPLGEMDRRRNAH